MKNKPLIVSTQKMAEILGITDRRVQQLVAETVFEKEGRGRYNVAKVVQAYMQYQVELQKEKQSVGSKQDEETRLLKERADALAMENEKTRGEIISLLLCELTWKTWVKSFGVQMLGVAPTFKTECPHIEDADIMALDKMIRKRLEELSKSGIPPELRKHVDNYTGDAQTTDEDDGE